MGRFYVLLLTAVLFRAGAQCPAVFADDFESGSLNAPWKAGAGHTVSISGSSPGQGLYSMQVLGASGFYAGPNATFTPSQPGYITWRCMTTNTSVPNGYFIAGDAQIAANNGIVFAYFNSNSGITFFNTTAHVYPVAANTWYTIELRNIDWGAKTFDIWINSVLWFPSFAFRSTASTNISRVHTFNLSYATSRYDQVRLDASPSITAVATPSNVCAGQSATITAGGNASSYSISGGITSGAGFAPAASAVYTVTGSNGSGCTAVRTVSVNVRPNPAITVNASTSRLCGGGSATLEAQGGVTYSWSDGSTGSVVVLNPQQSVVLTVTGTASNGCKGSQTASIQVDPLPSLSVNAMKGEICTGSSETLTATGADSYTWQPAGGNNAVAVVSPASTAAYTVFGANAAGCVSSHSTLVKVVSCAPVSVHDQQPENFAVIYPNPGNGNFMIRSQRDGKARLVSCTGQVVGEVELRKHTVSQLIVNVSDGLYFLQFTDDPQARPQRVIVKR